MPWIRALALALLLAGGGQAAAQSAPPGPSPEARGLCRAWGSIQHRLSACLRGGSQALGAALGRVVPQCPGALRATISSLLNRLSGRASAARALQASARSKSGLSLSARLGLRPATRSSLWLLGREQLRAKLAATPTGEKEKEKEKEKDWTIFVYLNGDNDLHKIMLGELGELSKVGTTERVNVVALWDGSKEYGRGDGKEGTKLLLVEKGGTKVLKDFGELDLGSAETLEQTLSLVAKEFPAQRTALIVANHGDGWRGVSFDDGSSSVIPVDKVGAALDRVTQQMGRKLDLLGYDACLMNIAEANFPVRNAARYVVASQELEYPRAWDFESILGALAQKPTMDGRELAKTVVQTYGKAYTAGGCYADEEVAVTLSAIDLEKFCGAMPHLDSFAEALRRDKESESDVIAGALENAQRFSESACPRSSMDLVDFARKIAATTQDPALKQCASRLDDYLSKEVIIANAAVGQDVENAHGMSIYFPGPTYTDGYLAYTREKQREAYLGISMAKETKWREMLDTYFPPDGGILP